MFVNGNGCDEVLEATKRYSEGVAISCHEHLNYYWKTASKKFIDSGIMTNFHNIISDKKSIDNFFKIYYEWKDKISYFVLLPHIAQGRAKEINLDWQYLFDKLLELNSMDQIAFGANFYPYLIKDKRFHKKVDLYEPEIMSKYLDMTDMTDMKIYKSSFNLEEI